MWYNICGIVDTTSVGRCRSVGGYSSRHGDSMQTAKAVCSGRQCRTAVCSGS